MIAALTFVAVVIGLIIAAPFVLMAILGFEAMMKSLPDWVGALLGVVVLLALAAKITAKVLA